MKSNRVRCAKPQLENLRSRKFCRDYGEELSLLCTRCGHKNRPGDKFCGECGHSLLLQSEVSPERGLTPFVGRERELELLLDGFKRAKEGRGQVFSIVAEAGMGKSRLAYEFRKAVAKEDLTFLEGRCLSYGRGMAYRAVIDILKSNFDIQDREEEGEVNRKVRKGLKALQADENLHLPYLLELLSLRDSGLDKIPLTPDARKNRMLEAFKWILLKKAESRPLVIFSEDLQWMDKSSRDTLRSFMEVVPGARVLMIFTYRPEFIPSWGDNPYHSRIALTRLSSRESLAMVSQLLGKKSLSRELEELILEKTEGVPFFIEEFMRSFNDSKIMEMKNHEYQLAKGPQAMAASSTIQDMIMARVDSQPEEAKELLQTASVIDLEFSHELIKRVSELSEQDLRSCLSTLKNAGLLCGRDIDPRSSYLFQHALTREAVYDFLPTKRKKELHGRIGRAVEDLYGNNLGEYADILSEHFIRSENYEKAAVFARLAGKKARQRCAYHDAVSYTYKEIFCLEKLESAPVREEIMDARITLANYCMQLNDPVEAYEVVSPIADLALRLDYRKGLPSIYTAIGSYLLLVEEDYPQGIEYLNQAMEFSEEMKDNFSLWNAYYSLGTGLSRNCEFQKALGYFQKSLDLSSGLNNPAGISSAKISMGINYLFQGKIDLAHQISQDVLGIADESGDLYVQGMSHSYYGTACYYKGFFAEAEDHLLKGITLGEKSTQHTWGSWASAFLGDMYFDLGEYEKSLGAYQRAFSFLGKRKSSPSWLNLIKVAMTRARVFKGDSGINLAEVINSFEQNKNRSFAGRIAHYISEILLLLDRYMISEAQRWVEKAVELDRKNGMRLLLAGDYALSAKISQKMGDGERSRNVFGQAIKIFQECGANGYWRKTGREIAAVA